jgi:hypothetical protein
MRRGLAALLLIAASVAAAGAGRVSRNSVAALEKSFDRRLQADVLEGDTFSLLGWTRGIYIEGFGVVYSAEVQLAQIPGISPFHREHTQQDWARVKQKKLQRLPALRTAMKQMMLDCAASLDGVAAEEKVVLGVTLTTHPNEDSTGVPSQIVMQSVKRDLLEVQTGKRSRAQLDSLIKVQEF